MRITRLQPGDEARIIDLFQQSFGRAMSPDFWHWRFCDHPAGGPLFMLAWDGDTLAASYSATHSTLRVDGEVVPSVLSTTTMTHPDYRGRGLMEACGKALYEDLAAEGMGAAWGFPNTKINHLRRARLGWSSIADVPTLQRVIPGAETFQRGLVETVAQVDRRFDAFQTGQGGIVPDHGFDFLSWRIDRNPTATYHRLVLPDGSSGALAGYAILKAYGAEDFDLVDLRASTPEAYTELIHATLAEAAGAGARRVNTWALPTDPARAMLERARFVPVAPVTYFGGRALGTGHARLASLVDDSRAWRISMLDSDVF